MSFLGFPKIEVSSIRAEITPACTFEPKLLLVMLYPFWVRMEERRLLTVVFPLVPVTAITVLGLVRCFKKSGASLMAIFPGRNVAFLPNNFIRNCANLAT
jgi:hypothetical protein